MKAIKIKRSLMYSQNIEKFGEHSDSCFICGKRTSSKFSIHVTTDFMLVDSESEDLSEINSESQGFFPIGVDCRKRYPSEFIFKS